MGRNTVKRSVVTLLLGVAFQGALLVATSANSAMVDANGVMLDIVDGKLVGASGVSVATTTGTFLFSVRFLDATCIDAFGGCDQSTDFTFTRQADALAASDALLSQVFVDSPAGSFDTNSGSTFGCLYDCLVLTPSGFTYYGVKGARTSNGNNESQDATLDFIDLYRTYDTSGPGGGSLLWAAWNSPDYVAPACLKDCEFPVAPNPSEVPLPAAAWLLLSGLGGLGLLARRKAA